MKKMIRMNSNEFDSPEVNQLVNRGFKRESEERETLISKYEVSDNSSTGTPEGDEKQEKEERKYTEKELQDAKADAFEDGWKAGWESAKDKFWAEGFDSGLKQARREQEGEL